jgi:tRNA(Ile)-lysidine synthase
MSRKIYVVAVSGGVDSVVLLHRIMSVKPPLTTYIVAHIDHGIRSDSAEDAQFVRELAESYGLEFELQTLSLGEGASEELARNARYDFLFSLMKKYKAEAVITAHHQDDVLETMIVNLLRGTGWRGLLGFSQQNIIRPFLDRTKASLLEYAKEFDLKWREDSTNSDDTYLRNYVRLHIVPKLGDKRAQLLKIRERVGVLGIEIDDLSKKILVQSMKKESLVRTDFVVLPYIVQLEVMSTWLRLNKVNYDQKTVVKVTTAAKTLLPDKQIELSGGAVLRAEKKIIVLKVADRDV